MNYFSKNIKLLRKRKRLTQAQMFDAIGFKQSTWNGYETGLSQPYMDRLIKISDFFDVPLSDLIEKDLSIASERSHEKKEDDITYLPSAPENSTPIYKEYSTNLKIIDTLSIAVRGLESYNTILLKRLAAVEEENSQLKKERTNTSERMANINGQSV